MAFNFFTIMNQVDYCLIGSIGQAAADATSLNVWTTSTTDKSDLWLLHVNPTIENAFKSLDGQGPDAFSQWMNANCLNGNVNEWSSAMVLDLQMLITKNDTKSSDWTAVVGAIGPFSSLISSAMTNDTTDGDTEGKNMQSQLQTDNSANQPIADFGSTWSQNISSLSNVLAQLSPA